jgi:transcriptional regulator with XRE-family HTH domain
MKNNPLTTPGQRLKHLREHLHITQSSAGDRLGLKDYQFRDVESGKVELSISMAKLIEYEFGASSTWLLDGKGEMIKPLTVAKEYGGCGLDPAATAAIERIRYIAENGREEQKALLYGQIVAVYDRILNERGKQGDSGATDRSCIEAQKKTSQPEGYKIKKPA